ncbi:alkaline phosphatase family protein [Citrobacter freundii]|uniref:alkaline phosphatase family protein n=1 Tax=Citrobacter freundii TaxID=546 RepID=UPI0020B85FAA|nr:alkaline phosphatase family protein [Citrobacter freundii]
MSIEFGPILNLRKTTGTKWTISALVLVRKNASPPANEATLSSGTVDNITTIASVPLASPQYDAVRYDFSIPLTTKPQTVTYQIGTEQFQFSIPAKNTTPNLAYVSCNGFSSARVMKDVEDKYNRWRDINNEHQKKNFNILLMGGDQIYSDSIWHDSATLEDWSNQWGSSRWKTPFTQTMHDEVDFLFFKIYHPNNHDVG